MKELNIIQASNMPIGTELTMIRDNSEMPDKVYIDNDTCLRWRRNDEPFSPYVSNINANFIPISKPVRFDEAISSGKRLKVDHYLIRDIPEFRFYMDFNVMCRLLYQIDNINVTRIITEGKWYIEESEE
jgi:hypothetical protein